MTFRGVRVLKSVDHILAEDTRRTRTLCAHYQIATPLLSFHDHNAQRRLPDIIKNLDDGREIALVSDAGTPGISDPGFILVRAVLNHGYRVVPLPGPSAVLTALVASGLPCEHFLFEGFLPRGRSAKRRRLIELAGERRHTSVFFEAPGRLVDTLTEIVQTMGAERPVTVAREITKLHETFYRGSAEELAAQFSEHPPRGEIVVIVGASSSEPVSEETARAWLHQKLNEGMRLKNASRIIARESGHAARTVYRWGLEEPGRLEKQ